MHVVLRDIFQLLEDTEPNNNDGAIFRSIMNRKAEQELEQKIENLQEQGKDDNPNLWKQPWRSNLQMELSSTTFSSTLEQNGP